jgi:hypothetical protein
VLKARVWLSGAALATRSTPMLPPAPPLLSITTTCPRFAALVLARMRATMSVLPPAGKGTARRIGGDGQAPGLMS